MVISFHVDVHCFTTQYAFHHNRRCCGGRRASSYFRVEGTQFLSRPEFSYRCRRFFRSCRPECSFLLLFKIRDSRTQVPDVLNGAAEHRNFVPLSDNRHNVYQSIQLLFGLLPPRALRSSMRLGVRASGVIIVSKRGIGITRSNSSLILIRLRPSSLCLPIRQSSHYPLMN